MATAKAAPSTATTPSTRRRPARSESLPIPGCSRAPASSAAAEQGTGLGRAVAVGGLQEQGRHGHQGHHRHVVGGHGSQQPAPRCAGPAAEKLAHVATGHALAHRPGHPVGNHHGEHHAHDHGGHHRQPQGVAPVHDREQIAHRQGREHRGQGTADGVHPQGLAPSRRPLAGEHAGGDGVPGGIAQPGQGQDHGEGPEVGGEGSEEEADRHPPEGHGQQAAAVSHLIRQQAGREVGEARPHRLDGEQGAEIGGRETRSNAIAGAMIQMAPGAQSFAMCPREKVANRKRGPTGRSTAGVTCSRELIEEG